MGTIGHKKSIGRDTEVTGPGSSLWASFGHELFSKELESVMESIRGKSGSQEFTIELTGHSLGGADAQNAATQMAKAISKSAEGEFKHISSCRVVTFNTAGVTKESAEEFDAFVNTRPGFFEKIYHSFVKSDVVQESGQTKIGQNITDKNKVCLIEVRRPTAFNVMGQVKEKHCDLVYASGPKVSVVRTLHDQANLMIYWEHFHGVGSSAIGGVISGTKVVYDLLLPKSVKAYTAGQGIYFRGAIKVATSMDKAWLEKALENLKLEQDNLNRFNKDAGLNKYQIEMVSNRINHLNQLTPEQFQEEMKWCNSWWKFPTTIRKIPASGLRELRQGYLALHSADH